MKTALITGPSSGIGRVTAVEMARLGYHIVAAGRSESRVQPVVDAIARAGGSAEFLAMDLGSLQSVRMAADEYASRSTPLDVLVNNAGVWRVRGLTADGFETHFGINHLGHFLLTHLLADTISDGARVVTVSSAVHQRVEGIDFGALTAPTKSIAGLDEYGVSKLANILFTAELARRRPEWRTYAVHPGFSGTGIIPFWAKPLVRSRLISPEAAAATSIWCATDPESAAESGGYYARSARATPSRAARDQDLAVELWERSADWCSISLSDHS